MPLAVDSLGTVRERLSTERWENVPEIVTANEIAKDLGVDPKRLRRWLRAQKEAGHPLLGGHLTYAKWEFSRPDADRLAQEFVDAASVPHASDSAVQREAEHVIRKRLAAMLGVELAPKTIHLKAGAPVQVDAATVDDSVLAEIFARQGELKGGQQKKVAIDTLKLITIREEFPGTRLIIAFADTVAAAYATGGGWVAQALKTWGVEVKVVDIPDELRARISAAQVTQTMVNPEQSDESQDIA
jgi:hypothetical protein